MRRFTWLLLVAAAVAACSGTTDDSTTATHPEVCAQAFRDPCCSGTPDGMLFTPESIAAQGAVVDEWRRARRALLRSSIACLHQSNGELTISERRRDSTCREPL